MYRKGAMQKRINDQEIMQIASGVLIKESEALEAAAKALDASFVEAVRLLRDATGKVVLTGLGKSGHVARKIAATMSSTGTSACFLHPTEALHGDLGVIGAGDIIVALAHGGETQEVLDVVRFAKRRDLQVIAITSKRNSSLAKLSDLVLSSRVTEEACPLGLAPTSSTTVTMALGDALAVCVMSLKGFGQEHFADFHPGGALGRRLSVVGDHMHSLERLSPLSPDDSFKVVLAKVTSHNFGIAAVVDGSGVLKGAITDGDLRRLLLKHEGGVFTLKALDMMTGNPKFVTESTPSLKALQIMEKANITSLFVLEDSSEERLLGVVRLHDLLAAKIV